ncbi:heavy-metal-associated domain-containing protein [Aliarcobacter butzleri]|uniref:heavy-metal-associated domain-containing protein n=1 Tax=Aliarcobacter butzleri TaxID=28197 RepID=UPI00244AA94C|nr:heavy-metal-associated domain-containing protein [Aliarcobacter butzleri]MDH1975436.1 heavy-metal-associated domain-containing protein [Aliarcobacter butzleri]
MKIIVLLFMIFNLSFASKITVFKVEGMHCPLCTTAIKKAINEIDGIKKVSARLNTKEVTVVYDEEKVKIEDILKAVKTTSYEAVELTTSDYKE